MSYFAATLKPRPLEPPHPVTLWQDAEGWRVTWGQPPLTVTEVQLTRGDSAPYAVVATVPAAQRWYVLPDSGGATIGVAYKRGAEVGAATLVTLPRVATPTALHPCPLCQKTLEWQGRLWHCTQGCGARWIQKVGQLVDIATLPYGVCTCCAQAQPLVQGDNQLLCVMSKTPYAPPLTTTDLLGAIDQALQDNAAKVGLFGLFDT